MSATNLIKCPEEGCDKWMTTAQLGFSSTGQPIVHTTRDGRKVVEQALVGNADGEHPVPTGECVSCAGKRAYQHPTNIKARIISEQKERSKPRGYGHSSQRDRKNY